ncbi:MAG: hypothetical protein WBL65_10820 [Bryobacteraceae bacterium]
MSIIRALAAVLFVVAAACAVCYASPAAGTGNLVVFTQSSTGWVGQRTILLVAFPPVLFGKRCAWQVYFQSTVPVKSGVLGDKVEVVTVSLLMKEAGTHHALVVVSDEEGPIDYAVSGPIVVRRLWSRESVGQWAGPILGASLALLVALLQAAVVSMRKIREFQFVVGSYVESIKREGLVSPVPIWLEFPEQSVWFSWVSHSRFRAGVWELRDAVLCWRRGHLAAAVALARIDRACQAIQAPWYRVIFRRR